MLRRVMSSTSTEAERYQPSSEVLLDEWVAPEIADERGYLRAGKILEWMDVVGVLASVRHCRKSVVTASVDGMELRHPISVGERVTLRAKVLHTSTRSMGVSVSLTHGNPSPAGPHSSVEAYMTFVAVDAQGKALPVPQVVPSTPEEKARFREGMMRQEFRRKLSTGQLPPKASPPPVAASALERAALTREILKLLPRFHLPWERGESGKPRARHVSYVHKIEPVRGGKLNFHGSLYGGTLMRWLETTAHLSARAHLDHPSVRLTSLHGLTFLRPILPNTFVHLHSSVVHTAQASLTVLVNVQSEDPVKNDFTETVRAFLTYSPEKPSPSFRIPALDCSSDEERALFEEVEHRLALQRSLGGE